MKEISSYETEADAMEAKPILWIVIPCYNEEAVLPITAPMFLQKLEDLENAGKISPRSRVLFVNDGSKDRTWEIIRELAEKHAIDCDGQDDVGAMDAMVDAYLAGSEVVYGVRAKRDTDTWFKRFTAEGFYKLLAAMGAEVVFNHADYRLVSSLVLNHFADYEEVNIFLRGMFPLVGFPSSSVYYDRAERLAGESHYPLKKMLALAFNGITSLSVKPISIITGLGIGVSILGVIIAVWAIVEAILGNTVAGWTSTICVVCLLGGIQLVSLGVIGQYVGKTYLETKRRPRYIISERTWESPERHWIEEK